MSFYSLISYIRSVLYIFFAIFSEIKAYKSSNLSGLYVQGASKKSNPLPFFVNISVMNWYFYKKIYADISHSYLRIHAKLCYIPSTFD